MFSSLVRDIGVACAVYYIWPNRLIVLQQLIHLFEAEIRHLVDELEASKRGSKREMLSLLPSLAVPPSVSIDLPPTDLYC